MPGVNSTGLPNPSDYTLGRGVVYFATLDANGFPLNWRDLGNCPEFNVSFESDTLEHQSSRSGLKITDKEVTISQKCKLALSLDEVNFQNLALVFSGTSHDDLDINLVKVGCTGVIICTTGQYVKNQWYDLYDPATGKRAYNLSTSGAGALTVKDNGVAITLNSDYTVDYVMGRIFMKKATLTGNLTFDIALNGSVAPVDEVRGLTTSAVVGALKFIGVNPADSDKKIEYQFHKVSLKPNGDFALIGDDWTKMQLEGVAEANAAVDANSPTVRIRTILQ